LGRGVTQVGTRTKGGPGKKKSNKNEGGARRDTEGGEGNGIWRRLEGG